MQKTAYFTYSPNHYPQRVTATYCQPPFGMLIKERSFSSDNYRFGFNGQEKEDEIKGEGNSYSFKFRIFDAKLGKFFSVDPLIKTYSWYSPYQFAGNMPIFSKDLEGLEPEAVINECERMLYTPYEFGGKNPNPQLIGIIGTKAGKDFWKNQLRPHLQSISNHHPDHYKPSEKGEVACSNTEKWKLYQEVKKGIYAVHANYTKGGYSLGIDCSGFVYNAFTQDKELLMKSSALNTGSGSQLAAFTEAEKSGQAILHQNFNYVSKGDFIWKKGHVMIATGNVKMDEKGNVIAFETMEAHDTKTGSVKMWRTIGKQYQIGHPFRTSDNIRQEEQVDVSNVEVKGDSDTFSNNSIGDFLRLLDNMQQTKIEEKPK